MYNVADILGVQYAVHVTLFNFCTVLLLLLLLLSLFPYISCSYAYALQLISHIRYKLEVIKLMLSFIHAFVGSEFCRPLLTVLVLQFRLLLLETSPCLSLSPKSRSFDRFATAANLVCNDVDIFSKQIRTIKLILHLQFLH
jgi:hypothetical protein